MTIELSALQQQRRDTAANWTGQNPTLLNGEIGYETDTGKFKIGDGSTAWTSLNYLPIPDSNGLIPIDQLLLPAGTAAAPSLTFTGDVDTGVYSVGANSFGISTAGTAALTIDSSQRVGIGTTSPSSPLTVEQSSANVNLELHSTSSGRGTQIKTHNDHATFYHGLTGDTSGNFIYYTADAKDHIFSTNNSERMRIDSSGNVGIGTTNPGSILELSDGSTTAGPGAELRLSSKDQTISAADEVIGSITFNNNDTSTGMAGVMAKIDAASNRVFDGDNASGMNLRFFAGDKGDGVNTPPERMRIDSLGNVGIGATDVNAPLEVRNSSALQIRTSTGTGNYWEFGRDNGSGDFFLADDALGTVVTVDQLTGNVGIGTSSPAKKLHIEDTSGPAQIRITGSSGSSDIYADSNIYFQPNGSTAVTFTSSGNVGIGTTSPGAILHTKITASQSNIAQFESGGGTLVVRTQSAGGGEAVLNAFQGASSTTAAPIVFQQAGSEKARLDSSGQVMIGVSSSSYNFTVAGTGYRGALIGSTNGNTAALLLDGASNGDGLGGDYGSISHLNTGELEINNRQANSITFKNTSSSTERMRIDSSGRLIVGRTSSVTSGSAADSIVQIVGKSGVPTDLGQLTIARGNSASNLTSGAEIGEIIFSDNTGGNFAQIQCSTDGTPGTNDYPGRLVFSTTADSASSPTERMRIDNRGRIFTYNSNTGNNSLTVGSAAAAGTSVAHYIGAYGATAVNTGTASFIVWTNGDVVNTNNSYGSISDAKLKENIVDANSQWNDLKAIQIRNYNFIEGQTHTQIGVVAQEVETVSPGLVSESPDRDEDGNDLGTVTKSVNYSVLYMKAVKALQEAMERIETLEQRLTDAGL